MFHSPGVATLHARRAGVACTARCESERVPARISRGAGQIIASRTHICSTHTPAAPAIHRTASLRAKRATTAACSVGCRAHRSPPPRDLSPPISGSLYAHVTRPLSHAALPPSRGTHAVAHSLSSPPPGQSRPLARKSQPDRGPHALRWRFATSSVSSICVALESPPRPLVRLAASLLKYSSPVPVT